MLMINMYILAAFTLLHLVTSNFLLIFIIRIGIGLVIAVDYTVGNAQENGIFKASQDLQTKIDLKLL